MSVACCVLVPIYDHVEPECERSLTELARRGYVVRRASGCGAIDQARSQMATDALRDGFGELLWIDSDIAFDPDEVERLRAAPHGVACGIYAKKGRRATACQVLPGTGQLILGEEGGLLEIGYAGAGFLLTRARVYVDIQAHFRLPICNTQFGKPIVPYFLPLVIETPEGPWYLGEDYAFCHRARAVGHAIWADTRIRLWHIGHYRYGWEDASAELRRHPTYRLNLAVAGAGAVE